MMLVGSVKPKNGQKKNIFFPFWLDFKFAGLPIDLHTDNRVAAY